jgi:hypothetical protein
MKSHEERGARQKEEKDRLAFLEQMIAGAVLI